jgi:hypothetical protein
MNEILIGGITIGLITIVVMILFLLYYKVVEWYRNHPDTSNGNLPCRIITVEKNSGEIYFEVQTYDDIWHHWYTTEGEVKNISEAKERIQMLKTKHYNKWLNQTKKQTINTKIK